MSGRYERVKEAVAATTAKLKNEVETSHRTGKIPADYSLGFVNALIFVDHRLNFRDGEAKFYDRTMAIGSLPKPMVLKGDHSEKDEEAFEFLRDAILVRTRALFEKCIYKDQGFDFNQEALAALNSLREALLELDSFTEKVEAVENQERQMEMEFKHDQENQAQQ